jgi:periplasmic copper chaperone A
MRKIACACSIALALLTTGAGAQQGAGSIEVQHAWARASAGKTGAAYFSVVNKGATPDRLVAVSTPAADKAQIHEDKMENGMMEMRPVGPMVIAPGQSAQLKPGADHVMLMGLKHPLKEGETFPLTLSFEKAGDIQVVVTVEKAGAMGADASHDQMQMEGGMDMK